MLRGLERWTPLSPEDKDRIRQEIIARCDLIGDCWVYRSRNSEGYGVKRIAGKLVNVSRFMLAYTWREPLNIGMDACHKVDRCSYRACCNPDHLMWGSHRLNALQREQCRREMQSFQPWDPRGTEWPYPVKLGYENTRSGYDVTRCLHLSPAHGAGRRGKSDRSQWVI